MNGSNEVGNIAMRYRLRTLVMLLTVGPPLLAAGYFWWQLAIEWTFFGVKVLVVSVGVFYGLIIVSSLALQCWEKYRRPIDHGKKS